jgi:DNA-binding NarL/FixJ family response regulator
MTRILIVDDHQLVRAGVRRLLEEEKDFEVVGEAAEGQQALDMAKELKPDVVLMDITMPGMDGIEATRRLTKTRGGPKVVVLTMHEDEHYGARLLRMGASGYVLKNTPPSELIQAIHAVMNGQRFVSSVMRESLALRFVEGRGDDPLDRLTNREFQVISRLATGAKNSEIANELQVSVKTIDAHRLNLLAKLGLRNNAELTRFALRHGLIKA